MVVETLSRASQPGDGEISKIEWEIADDIPAVEKAWPLTSQRLSLIREATKGDEELSAVFQYTDSGWPSHASSVAPIAQPYYGVRGHLSIHNWLIMYNNRLTIPRFLQADVLQKIHEGHQGITKCQARAHQSVWWPKIGECIVQIVQQGSHCQKCKPTTAKESMVPTVLPDRPWQMLGVDLLDLNGQQYMVVVNYYSTYIELVYLANHHAHSYSEIKVHICAFRYSRCSSVRQQTTFQFESVSTICGFIRFHTSDLKSILSADEWSVRASLSGRQNYFRQSDPMLPFDYSPLLASRRPSEDSQGTPRHNKKPSKSTPVRLVAENW